MNSAHINSQSKYIKNSLTQLAKDTHKTHITEAHSAKNNFHPPNKISFTKCQHQIEFFHDCGHQADSTIHIPSCRCSKKIDRHQTSNEPLAQCPGSSTKRSFPQRSCSNCGGIEGVAIRTLERRRLAIRLRVEMENLAKVPHQAPEQVAEGLSEISSSGASSEALSDGNSDKSSDESSHESLPDEQPKRPKQSSQGKKLLILKRVFSDAQKSPGKTKDSGKRTFKKTIVSLPSISAITSMPQQPVCGFDDDDDDDDESTDENGWVETGEDKIRFRKHLGSPLKSNPRKKGRREQGGN